MSGVSVARCALCLLFAAAIVAPATTIAQSTSTPDDRASHAQDFDFAFGTWKTHIKRLLHPLSGSSEWAEYATSSRRSSRPSGT